MNEYCKTLLVTDIDWTVFHHNPEGLLGYKTFIDFWIKNLEFNNSVLVYNTARPMVGYEEVKPYLYEPDLLVL